MDMELVVIQESPDATMPSCFGQEVLVNEAELARCAICPYAQACYDAWESAVTVRFTQDSAATNGNGHHAD